MALVAWFTTRVSPSPEPPFSPSFLRQQVLPGIVRRARGRDLSSKQVHARFLFVSSRLSSLDQESFFSFLIALDVTLLKRCPDVLPLDSLWVSYRLVCIMSFLEYSISASSLKVDHGSFLMELCLSDLDCRRGLAYANDPWPNALNTRSLGTTCCFPPTTDTLQSPFSYLLFPFVC